MKFAYLFCRYYPLCIIPVAMWSYFGDHAGKSCRQILGPMHGLMSPLVSLFLWCILLRLFMQTSIFVHKVCSPSPPYPDYSYRACHHLKGVMIIRAYAFCGRKKSVLMFLGFCYAIIAGLEIWYICARTPRSKWFGPFGVASCLPDFSSPTARVRVAVSSACFISYPWY